MMMMMMSKEQAKEAVIKYVARMHWVTYPEIMQLLEAPGFPVAGDVAMCTTSDPNVVFWGGMSEELVDLMTELLSEDKIHMHAAHEYTYLLSGCMASLPVAKRPPQSGYRKPHWYPVTFNPGPPCGEVVDKACPDGRLDPS